MQLTNEIITASPESVRHSGEHLFWSGKIDDTLRHSIEEFGQTTPVLAQESEDGLELLSGYARLAILRETKQPVLVRIVKDANETDKGCLYISENIAKSDHDGLRLLALKYFQSFMDNKTMMKEVLPRLSVKTKSKDAKLLMQWLNLPDNWQTHLAEGRVPLAAATSLGKMEDEDLISIEPLFTSFSWSRSNAVNLLTWIFETGKMTSQSVADVLSAAGIDEIMRQGLSPKDAISRLTTAAKTTRYPELTKLQETFTTAAREITAGTKWRLTQPNNFETGGAELSIQVKDKDQLDTAIKDLETLAALSPWAKIWSLGGQNG